MIVNMFSDTPTVPPPDDSGLGDLQTWQASNGLCQDSFFKGVPYFLSPNIRDPQSSNGAFVFLPWGYAVRGRVFLTSEWFKSEDGRNVAIYRASQEQ